LAQQRSRFFFERVIASAVAAALCRRESAPTERGGYSNRQAERLPYNQKFKLFKRAYHCSSVYCASGAFINTSL